MNKQELIEMAEYHMENSEGNLILKQNAISESVVGTRIFDAPLFAFAAAEDEYFKLLKKSNAIGEHLLLPQEWLPKSRTVISIFFPFTEVVKMGNRLDMSWPSEGWLHGRIEGQAFIKNLCQYLKSEFISAGYNSLVPTEDERFLTNGGNLHTDKNGNIIPIYTSNWSERHVAFVCGQGTFGLSKGLITKKGVAGRFGSIITELELSPDKREYENIYEYCSMCGSCVKNCPAEAISMDKGKNHRICADFLDKTSEKYKPRYGCGKCQIKVPCESSIPI